MSQYPTVYNQNTGDDDKDGGMGLDLGLDDTDDLKPLRSEYADGDDEASVQNKVEVTGK